MNTIKKILTCCIVLLVVISPGFAQQQPKEKLLGMYMHQHWAYKHPYAVRTWTTRGLARIY